jgi:predicted SprT family Zn-dependent metalloprotease
MTKSHRRYCRGRGAGEAWFKGYMIKFEPVTLEHQASTQNDSLFHKTSKSFLYPSKISLLSILIKKGYLSKLKKQPYQ